MPEAHDKQMIDRVLRMLATASRSLRLYPASSPIPRQSIEAVTAALGEVFAAGNESLPLAVARDGFETNGEPVAVGIPGGDELAADLRAHGVSALRFLNSTTDSDVLTLLQVLGEAPEEVRATGGFAARLASESVENITVTEVQLVVLDSAGDPDAAVVMGTGIGSADPDELANDPTKLAAWLAAAAAGDRTGLQSNLLSLVQSVGPQSTGSLANSLSSAFGEQSPETRDALLGLAMEAGPFRDLMGEMFRNQDAADIAGAVLGGSFGRNMLSLSSALTSLPLDRLDEAVRAQVHAMLPGCGHTDAEARFLDHMIAVRRRTEPEPSLAASDQTYLAVAQAAAIRPEDLERARRAVEAAGSAVDSAGVRAMLALLDHQPDAEQARASAEHLVGMVGRLISGEQIQLADHVLTELSTRSDRLPVARLFAAAATPEALGALVDAVLVDPTMEAPAGHIVSLLGDSAITPFVTEAIARKIDGLRIAEKMFGKRMMEPLNNAALHAQWFQLAPIVTMLAMEGDSRCAATIEALMRRPDPQARKEIVVGLAAATGQVAQQLLGELVADSSAEVAVAAARALAKSGQPGSGQPIATRITQLDLDNNDFELGRELIAALARTPDSIADELLAKLASRRALIKHGRFNDVQAAVNAARQVRAREAVGR